MMFWLWRFKAWWYWNHLPQGQACDNCKKWMKCNGYGLCNECLNWIDSNDPNTPNPALRCYKA